MLARYVGALWRYLGSTVTLADCRRAIADHLQMRPELFLATLDRAVFAWPDSPYRRLIEHAGIEREDIAGLLRKEGVEGTLSRLYEAGVRVSLEEFKGRRPVNRPGLELCVKPADFDNPVATRHYEARSGGSRGAARPILVDLALVEHDAFHYGLMLDAFAVWGSPTALWYPLPPGVAGLKQVLFNLKLGRAVERWFTQTPFSGKELIRPAAMTLFTSATAVARRKGFPVPRHVSPEDALRVARWLDGNRRRGKPAYFASTPSSGVRVCLAAAENGLDLTGTAFRFGGEPYTPAKASVVEAAGARGICQYLLSEVGLVGNPCTDPSAVGDVHVALDKVAVLDRPLEGHAIGRALFLTSLHPGAPKVMINVETGDSAVVEERVCGCRFGELGLSSHLHTIRSYEKLTSEGMNVVGSTLLDLVDHVLPARFGGHPTDYQLVEQETGGMTRVRLLVAPGVGAIDEADLVATILDAIRVQGRAEELMANIWGEAATIEVVRRKPYVTEASKILPLYRAPAEPLGPGLE